VVDSDRRVFRKDHRKGLIEKYSSQRTVSGRGALKEMKGGVPTVTVRFENYYTNRGGKKLKEDRKKVGLE